MRGHKGHNVPRGDAGSYRSVPPAATRGFVARGSAVKAGLSPEAVRSGGRRVREREARDGFIRQAVFAAGYCAAAVAAFVGCQASTVSRAL